MENIANGKEPCKTNNFNILKIIHSPFIFFEYTKNSSKHVFNVFFIIFFNAVATWFFTSQLETSPQLQSILSTNKNIINPTFLLVLKAIMTLGSFIPLLFNCLVNSFFLFILILTVKETISFRKLYYIIFLSQIPLIFKKILIVIPGFINNEMVPITSLGYILDSTNSNKFFIGILSQLEVFNVWSVFLVGIGLFTFANINKKKSFVLSFSFWIVMILISSLFNLLI